MENLCGETHLALMKPINVVACYQLGFKSLLYGRNGVLWYSVEAAPIINPIYICVSKLTINGLDNGLFPYRRQAIIWTNGEILLIRTLGTYLLSEIYTFSFKKMHFRSRQVVCQM